MKISFFYYKNILFKIIESILQHNEQNPCQKEIKKYVFRLNSLRKQNHVIILEELVNPIPLFPSITQATPST